MGKDPNIILFTPEKIRERLVRKIVDHRIATTATADVIGKSSRSVLTLVYYANWQRSAYFLGRRIK